MKNFKFKTLLTFLLLYIPINLFSCNETLEIHIVSPPRGSVFDKNEKVPLYITTFGGNIFINDQNTYANFTYSTELLPQEGLVFIKAANKGEELFDVISYLQGNLANSFDFLDESIKVNLGINIINNEKVSFASLTSDLMEKEELAPYVENPIVLDTEIAGMSVTIYINVTSVIAQSIDVTLQFNNGKLEFSSILHNVNIKYETSSSIKDSHGTAFYEQMTVSGELVLGLEDVDLINITTTASEPQINDEGGIPNFVMSLFKDDLDVKVREAIAVTTKNASKKVFKTLMTELIPKVDLDFEKPIQQQTQTQTITTEDTSVNLSYKTKILAQTSMKNMTERNFLNVKPVESDNSQDMTLVFGSRLVNQITYAMWDAGNTQDMSYSKKELLDLGMENPSGFYSKFNKTIINLLLPPILEWIDDKPYISMGGIEMKIFLDNGDVITARTAGTVPVKLTSSGNSLTLEFDENEPIISYDISYNKINILLKKDKMDQLILSVMPKVVKDLFSKFPIVQLVPVTLSKLNNSEGPTLNTVVTDIELNNHMWIMHLSFEKDISEH